MLGAELGTCTDTLVAIIGGKRRSIKTGLFHLIFNLISIIIGLLFIHQFTDLVNWMSGDMRIETKIANAHVLFNLIGAIIFIPLIPYMEKFLNKLVPDKPDHIPVG